MNKFIVITLLAAAAFLMPRYVGNQVQVASDTISQALPHAASPNARRQSLQTKYDQALTEHDSAPKAAPESSPGDATPPRNHAEQGFHLPRRLQGSLSPALPLAQRLRNFCLDKYTLFLLVMWAMFLLYAAVTLAGLLFSTFSWARSAGRANLKLATFELALLSFAAILFYLCGTNFLMAATSLLWASCVVFVLSAAGLMRLVDMNFPVWNDMVRTMSLPILASLIILAYDGVLPVLQAWCQRLT